MMEQEFVEMVLSNDVMLVCGDTGCGKSTQVPQFLYECGLCNGEEHLIGVTQPRRVAAVSVSQRVGQELNEPEKVGYQVRYDKSHCTKDMRIKFMTDGILLREAQADFLCRKYTAIVIDEAHERGASPPELLGMQLVCKRSRLMTIPEPPAPQNSRQKQKLGLCCDLLKTWVHRPSNFRKPFLIPAVLHKAVFVYSEERSCTH
ncbi:ECM16 [Symbiodinium pilosum]|uniref:ECM16 protein n=1 Tax=Symbiodinium pilosum TaxID=2952 RepID=A0A812WDT2_SYMPI|nr:ECM16 [Symbiodinium pilosum]